MKIKIFVATLALMPALALAGGSAMARPMSPGGYSQSIYCATREAGNPHSKYCDYMAWSSWRRRGGWDSSLDNACLSNPQYVPQECGGAAAGWHTY